MLKFTSMIITPLAVLGLTACATQTYEPVCKSADWESLGYKYAQGKANVESGDFYRRVCPNFGYEADIEAYEKGYRRGAEKFCTPSNGFKNGSRPEMDENVCAALGSEEYDTAYDDGVRVREIELRLKKLKLREEEIARYKRAINGGGIGVNFYGDPVEVKKTIKDLDDERQNIRILREKFKAELKMITDNY